MGGRSDVQNSSIYQALSGAWVFATGSNYWSEGLGLPGSIDARIQRATANVLNRLVVPVDDAPRRADRAHGGCGVAVRDPPDVGRQRDGRDRLRRRAVAERDGLVDRARRPARGTTSYHDSGLTGSTTYWYRVKAVNGAGSSGYSNTVSVTTQAPTASLFSESFPGVDGSAWDGSRWTTDGGDVGDCGCRWWCWADAVRERVGCSGRAVASRRAGGLGGVDVGAVRVDVAAGVPVRVHAGDGGLGWWVCGVVVLLAAINNAGALSCGSRRVG